MKQAPKKDMITAAGEGLRAKMSSMRGPTERMGKRVQEMLPAISNKFKGKAEADAKKAKMKPEPKKKK